MNDGLAPVITSDGGGATAAKSVVENTKAVTTVTATDGDTPASNLTYSIKGGADAALFEIDPVTGALTFKDAPNFENPQDVGKNNVYDVVVKVYDGVNSDDQAIAVKVKNVIDGVAPVIGSFGGSVDVFLPLLENKAAVVTIGATDADGDNLTYTLSGDDAARFAIDQATGALTFNKADVPDYEQQPADQNGDNIYDVTVKVSDGDHTVSQTLHIEILRRERQRAGHRRRPERLLRHRREHDRAHRHYRRDGQGRRHHPGVFDLRRRRRQPLHDRQEHRRSELHRRAGLRRRKGYRWGQCLRRDRGGL